MRERRVARKRKSHKAPMYVLLVLMMLMIVLLGMSFAGFISDDLKKENKPVFRSEVPEEFAPFQGYFSVYDEAAALYAQIKIDRVPENPEDVQTETVKVKTVVPESLPVEDAYFDDAIFIGDSISVGLRAYGVLPEKNVLAEKNVGLDKVVMDQEVYYTTGTQKKTLFAALKEKMPNPGKIYILLGSNGIPGYENEKHIQFYSQLIDRLQEKYPDAIIYVESVTPITADSDYTRSNFNMEKIRGFNELVLKMAEEKGLYYLNISEVLTDENGYLKKDYDGGDGMHLMSNGHKAILDYCKRHTVRPDGTTDQIVKK